MASCTPALQAASSKHVCNEKDRSCLNSLDMFVVARAATISHADVDTNLQTSPCLQCIELGFPLLGKTAQAGRKYGSGEWWVMF